MFAKAIEAAPTPPEIATIVDLLMLARGTPSLLSRATMQHFPGIRLTSQEARVLGCLLEKQILTPGSYPQVESAFQVMRGIKPEWWQILAIMMVPVLYFATRAVAVFQLGGGSNQT